VGFRGRLLLVTAFGAVWRLGYLIVAKADQPLLLNDSIYFSIQAGLNSEGHWFEDALTGQPGAEHGMLTSLYLTPWSIGGGDSVFPQRMAMTLLGIATVFVIGMTGRRLGIPLGAVAAERIGLTAAALAAVYPNLWINDSLVMSEALAILLVSMALYVAIGHHARPTIASGILVGVLAGLGALTRSEIALLIPGFAIVSLLAARRRRQPAWPALAIAAAGVVTLLPWSVYNFTRFEEPVLLSTNDGNTLLGANCDRTYYDDVGGWDIRCLGPLEPGTDASQRSRERRGAAFEYVADHIERSPVVVVARAGRLLDLYGIGSLVTLDVGEEKARWAVWTGIVAWWLLAPAALCGWIVLARNRIAARWWLLVPCIAVLLTALLFYGAHRIRAPAEPVVVLLAAVAAATVLERRRGGRLVR
jgi:4-amino-4-deoxy-L-arabinose transferase-like glycosyltransferase